MNGVSRQAVESRHETQVEEMTNCTVSFVDGTRRRNPVEYAGSLPELTNQEPYLYSYERGDGLEAYIIAIVATPNGTDGTLYVYNVDNPVHALLVEAQTSTYLAIPTGAKASESFSATTIADVTVVVNKTKTVLSATTFTHGINDKNYHQKYAYYWAKRSYIAYGGTDNQEATTYQYLVDDGVTPLYGANYDTWSTSKAYTKGDKVNRVVSGISQAYTATLASTGVSPESDATKWELITGAVRPTDRESALLSDTDAYSSSTAYVEGNIVTYISSGIKSKYECIVAGSNNTPTNTSLYWSRISNTYGKNTLTVANTLAGDLPDSTNSGSVLRQLKKNLYPTWDAVTAYTIGTKVNHLVNGSSYSYEALGSSTNVTPDTGTTQWQRITGEWSVSDSWGNMASEGWWGYMKKIQDLPNDMAEYSGVDTLIKITGDQDNGFEGFWATYEEGTWKESVQAGISEGLDPSTMPHTLTRNSRTSFTLAPYGYTKREVGDEFSNPLPSFVGKTIEDIFFYRNRLGIISGDKIILSEVAMYENFFRTTVTDLLASDPIDLAVDTNKVATLKYAIPFKRNLLLFGTNAQYILSTETTLAPDTATVSQSTTYQINTTPRPVPIGANTYFTVNKGDSTQVREYYNVPDSVDNTAQDITAHISTYVPKNAIALEASTKYDMLFVLSSDSQSELYVYNQTWEGEKKTQSAWHKWVFPSNVQVNGIRVFGDYLYLIYTDSAGAETLGKMSLASKDYTSVEYIDQQEEYESSILLSEWGFQSGGQSKVDDKQGRLQIRKVEVQTREGSQQKLQIQVGESISTSTGTKATVMGETKRTSIKILNKDTAGFCIDSTNLKGRYNSKTKTV